MPNDQRKKRRVVAGIVLIIVGAALFWLNVWEGPEDYFILIALGGAFLAGHFYTKSYGLLIPGCILLGLGLGELGERSWFRFHEFKQLGLGLGFIAIFVIDRARSGSASWWPLIPGVILVGHALSSEYGDLEDVLAKAWPLLLVIIGLVILVGSSRRARPKDDDVTRGPHET